MWKTLVLAVVLLIGTMTISVAQNNPADQLQPKSVEKLPMICYDTLEFLSNMVTKLSLKRTHRETLHDPKTKKPLAEKSIFMNKENKIIIYAVTIFGDKTTCVPLFNVMLEAQKM